MSYLNYGKQKDSAHRLVDQSIKKGLLIRLPCVICGNKKSYAHHDNYLYPLKVTFLCSFHHGIIHRIYKEFKFSTNDGLTNKNCLKITAKEKKNRKNRLWEKLKKYSIKGKCLI